MMLQNDQAEIDQYKIWMEWSPKPKKEPAELSKIVSAIVLVTAAIQITNVPILLG